MPRKPSDKPWLHAASGYWCITLDGKRRYLDANYRVANRKLKALRADKKREQVGGGREWLDASFAELANEYLADVKVCKKPATSSDRGATAASQRTPRPRDRRCAPAAGQLSTVFHVDESYGLSPSMMTQKGAVIWRSAPGSGRQAGEAQRPRDADLVPVILNCRCGPE